MQIYSESTYVVLLLSRVTRLIHESILTVRRLVQTINAGGAVLETAAPMDVGLNFFEIPGKGPYATLARYAHVHWKSDDFKCLPDPTYLCAGQCRQALRVSHSSRSGGEGYVRKGIEYK